MMPDLVGCPFCSGRPEIVNKHMRVNGFGGTVYRVRCSLCHAQSPYKRNSWLHGWHETMVDAAEAWNRRADG